MVSGSTAASVYSVLLLPVSVSMLDRLAASSPRSSGTPTLPVTLSFQRAEGGYRGLLPYGVTREDG